MAGKAAGPPDAIWAYGCSYAVVRHGVRGRLHYLAHAARRLGGLPVHSYARNGTRIVEAVGAMLLDAPLEGCRPPVPGAAWPGVARRPGVVVVDTLFNDVGHYPDSSIHPVVPAPLADGRYVEGIATMTRAAIAVASSESRVPVSEATLEGTWLPARVLAVVDPALVADQPGARAAFRVAPPASGPLAGRVFLLGRSVDPQVGTLAPMRVVVDGHEAGQQVVPHAWESYVGHTGETVRGIVHCVGVHLPADGQSHDLTVVHDGRPGELVYVDAVVVPAEEPGPVVVMGSEAAPRARLWSQAEVATWAANHARIAPRVQEVVAEFPHARYAPSSISPRGLSFRDGIHANPWGNVRRARDLRRALGTLPA